VLDQVFGDRGVRVVGAFLDMGVEGFDRLATSMEENRSVSEKFRIVMEGLTGMGERFVASAKRLAIAFAGSLSDGLRVAVNGFGAIADRISYLLETFPQVGRAIGVTAGALALLGGSALAASAAISAFNFVLRAVSALATAMGAAKVAMVALGGSLANLITLFDAAVASFGLAGGILASIGYAATAAWELVVAGAARVTGALSSVIAWLTNTEGAFLRWASELHMFQVAKAWLAAFTVRLAAAWTEVQVFTIRLLASASTTEFWLIALIHAGNAARALGAYVTATGAAIATAFQGAVAWATATTTAITATIAEVGLAEAAVLGWGLATETVFFAMAGLAASMSTALATATAMVVEFGAMVMEVGLLEALAWGMAAAWDAVLFAVTAITAELSLGLIPLIAAATVGLAYLFGFFGSSKKAPDLAKAQEDARNGIARSGRRDPMSEPGQGESVGMGKSVGTFNADVANRLGIGPETSAADATARNTSRTADATEELVRMQSGSGGRPPQPTILPAGASVIPPAENLQAGMARAGASATPTAPSNWDRDLLSVAERTALATEGSLAILRNILTATKSLSPAFG
jgi:hypothetical protein